MSRDEAVSTTMWLFRRFHELLAEHLVRKAPDGLPWLSLGDHRMFEIDGRRFEVFFEVRDLDVALGCCPGPSPLQQLIEENWRTRHEKPR